MKMSRWNAPTFVRNGELLCANGLYRGRVAIIACDPSNSLAPFDDDTWEVWGCNSMWNICRDSFGDFRADRWFEMHPMSVQTEEELKAICTCPVPIYHLGDATIHHAPFGLKYPLDEVLDYFHYRYFTCTFAYQIALAIYEGFSTIGLFGVELDQGTARERMVEKACVEFWIGLARGAGVKVVLPEGSRLCTQSKLYGYDYHEEVDEVNGIVDGLFFRRIQELERSGLAERIPINEHWQEGNA